jgi:midasin
MTFLDGLGSLPQLTAYSPEALQRLKADSLLKLQEIAPVPVLDGNLANLAHVPAYDPAKSIQFGSFTIPKGPIEPIMKGFNFQTPTTQSNAMCVVRACQVSKPILLEGSPGVGKTSLITALANISGYRLFRINLSDQTDLTDLFGSDLPLEGGGPGEFIWKDADFLKAMQEGHWVLLDEMNLAPHAVLEGLNAALDHRGTVYIPELGRSFIRHPLFRIFAAQNPLNQGCGRKGLPRSFVDRFTKVYVEGLLPTDLLLINRHLFPEIDVDILRHMITFNSRLAEEITLNRAFAPQGGPWEFNLRDLVRWGRLLSSSIRPEHPVEYLRSIYLHRFRTSTDRNHACTLFGSVFCVPMPDVNRISHPALSSEFLQLGHFHMRRSNISPTFRPPRLVQAQISVMETMGHCISQSWLLILTGPHRTGKTSSIRALANSTGNLLHEVSISGATDAMDLLGSFEQVDVQGQTFSLIETILSSLERHFRSVRGSKVLCSETYTALRNGHRSTMTSVSPSHVMQLALRLVDELINLEPHQANELSRLQVQLQDSLSLINAHGRFEWIDGPLVQAIKMGHWIILDGANLCNPSVLDRLNSLCEENGVLTLSERGYVNGEVQIIRPHPNFRLFMTVDPHYGELSRAMRNRGMEIAVIEQPTVEDQRRFLDHLRLPMVSLTMPGDLYSLSAQFDVIRRGIYRPLHQNYTVDAGWPSGRPLDDSALSSVVDFARSFCCPYSLPTPHADGPSIEASIYFFARTTAPTYCPYIIRFLKTLGPMSNPYVFRGLHLMHALYDQQIWRALGDLREVHARSRGISSEFMLTQASVDVTCFFAF